MGFEQGRADLANQFRLMVRADPAHPPRLFEKVEDLVQSSRLELRLVPEPRPGRHQDSIQRGPVAAWLRTTPVVGDLHSYGCDDGIDFAVFRLGLGQRFAGEELAEQRGKFRQHVERMSPRGDLGPECFEDQIGEFTLSIHVAPCSPRMISRTVSHAARSSTEPAGSVTPASAGAMTFRFIRPAPHGDSAGLSAPPYGAVVGRS